MCADATAAWHASWLDSFGVPWERDERTWRALARPPFIYLGAITLSPDATADDVVNAPNAVYDSWNALELEPFDFHQARIEVWYVRRPGPLPDAADPGGLTVERVDPSDLVEFEAVSIRGFGGKTAHLPAGTIHPPNPDPRMSYWLGRVDGEAVSVAMSYVTDRAVGVFGVATVESARGRGYASALMRRAVCVDTGLPAALNTDNPDAMRVYERLGFQRVGDCPLWFPGPVKRTDPDGVRT